MVIFLQNQNPSLQQKLQTNPNGGRSTKYLSGDPQNCQDHKRQGKTGKLSQNENEEPGRLNVVAVC